MRPLLIFINKQECLPNNFINNIEEISHFDVLGDVTNTKSLHEIGF